MDNPDGYRYSMMGAGGGWMVGFAVVTLVLLGVAVLAVLAHLYLQTSHRPHLAGHPAGHGPDDAHALLDARLARGEVTPEEYRSVRAALDGG